MKAEKIYKVKKREKGKFIVLISSLDDPKKFGVKIKLKNLLRKTGLPVAPSANLVGKPPATNIAQAEKYFGSKIDFYLDEIVLENRQVLWR